MRRAGGPSVPLRVNSLLSCGAVAAVRQRRTRLPRQRRLGVPLEREEGPAVATAGALGFAVELEGHDLAGGGLDSVEVLADVGVSLVHSLAGLAAGPRLDE